MSRPISETVSHESYAAGGTDTHGNPADGWGAPVVEGIYAFDPGSSSEPRVAGQARVIVEPTIYFPSGIVFGPHDRVTVRGHLYEVEGETREWVHPTTGFSGNVATLRRVDG